MKKAMTLFAFIMVLFTLTACHETKPETPSQQQADEITKAFALKLFDSAASEIITLATNDPTTIIKTILGDDVSTIPEEIHLDSGIYYKTTASFQKLEEYYAQFFTGEALEHILSTKFANVDGALYCSAVGGATGWSISNAEITDMTQNDDKYECSISFNEVEYMKEPSETVTSQFTVEKVQDSYKISDIDYLFVIRDRFTTDTEQLDRLCSESANANQPTEAAITFFYKYYRQNNYELAYMPEFDRNTPADWNALTQYVYLNYAFPHSVSSDEKIPYTISQSDFDATASKLFGDIGYSHRSSSFLTLNDGVYSTPDGFSFESSYHIMLKEIKNNKDGTYSAVFDCISIDSESMPKEIIDKLPSYPMLNRKELEQAVLELFLEERFNYVLQPTEQWHVNFSLTQNNDFPIMYHSLYKEYLAE